MFNNRIRTAALAGAIAISTAASGVAIPAFAQETGTNPTFNNSDNFNDADGSTIQPVGPVNHTEDQLKALTDATGAYLSDFQNGNLRGIVADLIEAGESGFDPSEQAAYEAFEAARVRATEELAASAQTITKTRESVNYALKVDREATEAFEAYRAGLQGAAADINPLISAANAANETNGRLIRNYDALYFRDISGSAPLLNPAYNQLKKLQAEVNEDLVWLGEWAIDNRHNDYVTRYHVPAVEALKAEIDARLEAIEPLRADAIAKNLEAQKSDVLVRQLFLERATAQRDSLRVIEATFSTTARYIELYENVENINVEGKTLRTHYAGLYASLFDAAAFNLGELNRADAATERFFLSWWTDRRDNDEQREYDRAELKFAIETYAKIFINGQWQEKVAYVQNLDSAARAEAARVEAERLADEAYRAEQLRIAQEAADAQKAIADALAAKDDEKPAGDDKENGSSSDIGTWGPFAAIAAIIAAIAAIFPMISGILKF